MAAATGDIGKTDHGVIPQILVHYLGDADLEASTGPVDQAAQNLPLILEGLAAFQGKFNTGNGGCHLKSRCAH